jgi:hypothetical protein
MRQPKFSDAKFNLFQTPVYPKRQTRRIFVPLLQGETNESGSGFHLRAFQASRFAVGWAFAVIGLLENS